MCAGMRAFLRTEVFHTNYDAFESSVQKVIVITHISLLFPTQHDAVTNPLCVAVWGFRQRRYVCVFLYYFVYNECRKEWKLFQQLYAPIFIIKGFLKQE